jgi:hypothetical protein
MSASRLVVLTIILFSGGLVSAGSELDLVKICKQECPKAKTNEEAHKCAEKNGRLNKDFRKSKCWEENEKYESSIKENK